MNTFQVAPLATYLYRFGGRGSAFGFILFLLLIGVVIYLLTAKKKD